MKNIYVLLCVLLIGCNPQSTPATNVTSEPLLWYGSVSKILATNMLLKNFYVVFDGSGSMDSDGCAKGSTKERIAKKALITFANELPKEYNLGLLVFDGQGITERVKLGTGNRDVFVKKVQEADTNSNTPLQTSITKAVRKLQDQAGTQLGYGEYHLVIITDGDSTDGSPGRVLDFVVDKTPIVVHTLGFCIGNDHVLKQPGRTLYTAANSPSELIKGLREVLAEESDFTN